MVRLLVLLIAVAPVLAAPPTRICIYGGNRGASKVHRAILKQARKVEPRMFLMAGDVLDHADEAEGTPEAVLEDYRTVFSAPGARLDNWPLTPGPVIFAAPGGSDEQYFVPPEMAEGETRRGWRAAYEGTADLGMQLYDALNLDLMRLRVQPLPELGRPVPMSEYGDYLLVTGTGPRRECAVLVLYRTDRWGFREEQVTWVEQTLTAFRNTSPTLPLIAVASDWTWFFPDTLDDGRIDGRKHAVREGSPEADQKQKQRLYRMLREFGVDVAVAAGRGLYWAGADESLLRINCAAARCAAGTPKSPAPDTVWLEYIQTQDSMFVTAHPMEPPTGCGIRPDEKSYGLTFAKRRAAGASWRTTNP